MPVTQNGALTIPRISHCYDTQQGQV
jgi:hypothetical protein